MAREIRETTDLKEGLSWVNAEKTKKVKKVDDQIENAERSVRKFQSKITAGFSRKYSESSFWENIRSKPSDD